VVLLKVNLIPRSLARTCSRPTPAAPPTTTAAVVAVAGAAVAAASTRTHHASSTLHHNATIATPAAQKNGALFKVLSLCLSRACLGQTFEVFEV
jgi:hypothetical protein